MCVEAGGTGRITGAGVGDKIAGAGVGDESSGGGGEYGSGTVDDKSSRGGGGSYCDHFGTEVAFQFILLLMVSHGRPDGSV